ncbi:serine/threonine-protein kinase/endoribonuclease IRE1-like [Asterias amurensis]|uniref:serine/threonine-protein kinase/endoribonuclease IRE1-like n=1 Tax=Asterias amurensis TaxID=7602 RepID=UPI003AB33E09
MMFYNNEPVAVKCVPTGDKDTVDREVRILSVLSEHDSFPNLHGTIEVGQFRAVAMQFIGVEALAKCLTLGEALEGSRSLTLDPADWRSIAMNVVDGIKHMHSEGLLHNDIKMDNILMSYDTQTHRWRAYVIDVGVATTTNTPRNYVLTSDEKKKYRRFHGHIAPEMVDNAKPQSTQSDIFQLGWVLYFIGKLGAVPLLEQLGDQCKSPDPSQRPEITHIRYCIQNNIFI